MSEEIVAYSYTPLNAAVRTKGQNYLVDAGMGLPAVTLRRDVDFGVIPGTKKPSLYKPGAEKIATSYGLCQRYSTESKIEELRGDNIFCFYLIRCDLVKIIDGKEYIITSAYGSANTNEKRNGRNSAWDAANGTVKMAQKRSLVGAVLALCSGSDMFTQDIEDEDFMRKAGELAKEDPEGTISHGKQVRLYATGTDCHMTQAEVKKFLAGLGYSSTKAIKNKDYDAVIEKLKEAANNGG